MKSDSRRQNEKNLQVKCTLNVEKKMSEQRNQPIVHDNPPTSHTKQNDNCNDDVTLKEDL